MKWIPYIAIWIYGFGVAGLGVASIFNPTNADSVAGGSIPTDVFTFVGIIILYFAYASTKQYFHAEARDKKRFDLLIIAVLNIVVMVVPIIFLAWFAKNTFNNMSLYSGESGYYQSLIGEIAVLLVIVASFFYNVKLFLYNK